MAYKFEPQRNYQSSGNKFFTAVGGWIGLVTDQARKTDPSRREFGHCAFCLLKRSAAAHSLLASNMSLWQ
jgi:hypothetical protein